MRRIRPSGVACSTVPSLAILGLATGLMLAPVRGAAGAEPYRDPDWIWMTSTTEAAKEAVDVLNRSREAYSRLPRYEHKGKTSRVQTFIGSRVEPWDMKEDVYAAFQRDPLRYAFETRGCRVVFDGANVTVRMESLKAFRSAPADAQTAADKAVELGDRIARLPQSLRYMLSTDKPLEDVLAALQVDELVGVIPEARDGHSGHWVVWAQYVEQTTEGIRMIGRWWFDDESGLLRALERDESPWYRAQTSYEERRKRGWQTQANYRTTVRTTLDTVSFNSASVTNALVFRADPGDRPVTFFAWPPCGAGQPTEPVSNEPPELMDMLNQPLGPFSVTATDGAVVSSASTRNRPLLLLYCMPGTHAADYPGQYQHLLTQYPSDRLSIVLVVRDPENYSGRELSELTSGAFKGTVVLDKGDKMAALVPVKSSPFAVFVDAGGIVRDAKLGGAYGDADEDLERRTGKLVSGELAFSAEQVTKRRAAAKAWADYWKEKMPASAVPTTPERQTLSLQSTGPSLAAVSEPVGDVGWGWSFARRWVDLDADGHPELPLIGRDGDIAIISADGQVRSVGIEYPGVSRPQIDNAVPVRSPDGALWAVAYRDLDESAANAARSSPVLALFAHNGKRMWTYEKPRVLEAVEGNQFDSLYYSITATDLDGDGADELVIGGSISRMEPTGADKFSATGIGDTSFIAALDRAGRTLSFTQLPKGHIGWIEPLPAVRGTVLISLDSKICRVEFSGLPKH